jgi:molecular chaperone HtpG
MMLQNKLDMPKQKRALEINPEHEIIVKIKERFEKGMSEEEINDTAQLLFGQALLSESTPLPDPAGFAKLVAKLMA